jgi:small subunit ribosomal protein S2
MTETATPLVSPDVYERHAVHIGTNQKSADMKQFLDTMHQDSSGLHIIDVNKTDERIRVVSKFLSHYEPSRILVVSARQYGQRPARKFAQAIGAKQIVGRFIPGTLTNPRLRTSGLPVVAICDANNRLRNVDIALPANNKGRRSLALVYWLLAREMLKAKGTLKSDLEFELAENVDDWESTF